jgi:hypothetical protein
MENDEWKPFRSGLDKSDRKRFDEMMFDILDSTFQLALTLFSMSDSTQY